MKTLIVLVLPITVWSQCLQADIVLLGDYSGSIFNQEHYIVDAFRGFADRFELSQDGVRMGVTVFNATTTVLTEVTHDKNRVNTAIQTMSAMSGTSTTNMFDALVSAQDQLMDRPMAKKIIVLLTDGKPDSRYQTVAIAKQIMALPGWVIVGVALPGADQAFMEQACTVYVNVEWEELVRALKEMDVCM